LSPSEARSLTAWTTKDRTGPGWNVRVIEAGDHRFGIAYLQRYLESSEVGGVSGPALDESSRRVRVVEGIMAEGPVDAIQETAAKAAIRDQIATAIREYWRDGAAYKAPRYSTRVLFDRSGSTTRISVPETAHRQSEVADPAQAQQSVGVHTPTHMAAQQPQPVRIGTPTNVATQRLPPIRINPQTRVIAEHPPPVRVRTPTHIATQQPAEPQRRTASVVALVSMLIVIVAAVVILVAILRSRDGEPVAPRPPGATTTPSVTSSTPSVTSTRVTN